MRKRFDPLYAISLTSAVWAPAQWVAAAEYLSVEAAQKAIFPEATAFKEVALELTPAQRQAVLALAGAQPPRGALRVWRVLNGPRTVGHFFTDEVVGRQDFIDYALGINADGSLRTLEVMAYRESHGNEIRNTAWRKQFAQRRNLAELRFQTDIKNIAGATLSCGHVTAGVRYLTALWQTALRAGVE
jgi:hypothetical protein